MVQATQRLQASEQQKVRLPGQAARQPASKASAKCGNPTVTTSKPQRAKMEAVHSMPVNLEGNIRATGMRERDARIRHTELVVCILRLGAIVEGHLLSLLHIRLVKSSPRHSPLKAASEQLACVDKMHEL